MADYRIQITATKASWVGDKAYYELTARISTRRKGIPFPEGEFIVFDPGPHRKQIDSRGIAFLRLSTDRQGVFTTVASLESDLDIRDEVEVVIPEKPIPISAAKKKVEDDKARAESAEAKKRIREANKKQGAVHVLREDEKLRAEIREFRQKGLPTPNKFGEPTISFPGRRGRYRLHVFQADDQGQPLLGVPVNVTAIAPDYENISLEFLTDPSGRVDRWIGVVAEDAVVEVRVNERVERFEHLEALPPEPMTIGQRLGLGIGLSLVGAVILLGIWLSTTAP